MSGRGGVQVGGIGSRHVSQARWSLSVLVGLLAAAATAAAAPHPFNVVDGGAPLPFLAVSTTALGLAAGTLLTAPVTLRRVGRIELGLRVALVAPMLAGGISVARSVATGGSGAGGVAAAFVTGTCLLAVLVLVAVLWWQAQRVFSPPRPGGDARRFSAGPEPLPPLCGHLKRGMDVVVAGASLVVAVPVVAVAAVAITVGSRGGWLFTQTRVGLGGRPFRLLKLRTMVVGNDDTSHKAHMAALIGGEPMCPGTYGKVLADARRTTVGAVLRRWSIDELPQLWNVLKGDMSVVGPRPPLPWEVELYNARAAGRLAARPGMTGLWQVSGRGRLRFDEMIELDLRYLESWSPWLDLKILARTPAAVWSRYTE